MPAAYRQALLPFFPYFTHMVFVLYYHKIPNSGNSFVLDFMIQFFLSIFLEMK